MIYLFVVFYGKKFAVFDLLPCDAGISWIEGDAEELPVATASVDAYTIAFGIRNVTRIHKVRLLILQVKNFRTFKCLVHLQRCSAVVVMMFELRSEGLWFQACSWLSCCFLRQETFLYMVFLYPGV